MYAFNGVVFDLAISTFLSDSLISSDKQVFYLH